MADRRITIAFGIVLPLGFIVAVALILLFRHAADESYLIFFSR
jgi:hypothetical protein